LTNIITPRRILIDEGTRVEYIQPVT